MKRILLGAGALLALHVAPVDGQDVRARAYVDRNPAPVNQQFTLYVEVTGVRGLDGEPGFPQIDSFARYLGSQTSTSMQVAGGRTSVTYTLQYRFIATEEGDHVIPSMEVRAGGETLTTDPVPLTISALEAGGGQSATGGPGVTPEDLFVVAEPSKRRVYENEPVVVDYRIFTRVNVSSYSVTSIPGTEGFWVEEIPSPESPAVEQIVRDGVQYASAVVRRVTLFPTSPGTKTLGPLELEARVRVRRQSRDIFDDFFGGSSLFGSVEPVLIASNPVEVEVLSLPAGKPSDFSGFVGSLDVDTRVDRSEVDANDAVTLSVELTGEGNLAILEAPELNFPADFEVFEPEVTDDISRTGGRVRGSRRFDYVLIPRAPGTRELPTVEVSYFDLSTGRYSTASTAPIGLEVTGEVSTLLGTGLRAGVETLREDIRFIRLGAPRLSRRRGAIFGTAGFWIVALLPLAAVTGALGLRRHQDRLAGDQAYARERRAGRLARRRLAEAKSLSESDGSKAFYAEVARALQGYLADKLDLAEAGLMSAHVSEELDRRGVVDDVTAEYIACLEHCDRARFSPAEADSAERSAFLARAESAMTALARELGK